MLYLAIMVLYYFPRVLVLIVTGLLVYGQTFHYGFVFDDHSFIVDNPYIKNLAHVPLMWHSFPKTRLVGIYSFALNFYINGLRPGGYHIFNFMVHLACTLMVWALAERLLQISRSLTSKEPLTQELPFIMAMLFLVHPGQTQAVSYITQRFESMAAFFYLVCVYGYISARVTYHLTSKMIFYGLSLLGAVLGVFTKETIITVPAMLICAEWILFPKKDSRLYATIFFLGILLYLILSRLLHTDLSVFSHPIPSDSHAGDILTPVRYFLTQMRVFLTFLRLLALPIRQNADYDYPVSTSLFDPPLTLLGLCVICGFIYLIIKIRPVMPLAAFGLAWMLVTFSINLAPRANVIFEHKLYLISFGFILAMVTGLASLIKNKLALLRLLGCIIILLGILSFQRNHIWKDPWTLWDDVVKKSPNKARPLNNRGLAYADKGDFTRALADYDKAIRLNPRYINTYVNRGYLYSQSGDLKKAIANYSLAIKLDPDLAGAYIDRGNALGKQGLFEAAIRDFNKAIEIGGNSAESYNDRGNIFFQEGLFNQAIADYTRTTTLDPGFESAYYNLGFIYSKKGNYPQAIVNYTKALEINPRDKEIYDNRAITYFNLKEYDKAWDDVRALKQYGGSVDPQLFNALSHIRDN